CGAACAASQRSGPFSLCLGGEDPVESYLGTAGKFGPERPRNPPRSNPGRTEKRALTMGYGVIGNTTVSGTVILGSSPGTPALHSFSGSVQSAPRSSSGPGRRPLTAVTPVQIRYGVRVEIARSRSGPVRLAAQDAALPSRCPRCNSVTGYEQGAGAFGCRRLLRSWPGPRGTEYRRDMQHSTGPRITVGVFDADESDQAVRWAARHAGAVDGSLHLVHAFVWTELDVNIDPISGMAGSGFRGAAHTLIQDAVAIVRE